MSTTGPRVAGADEIRGLLRAAMPRSRAVDEAWTAIAAKEIGDVFSQRLWALDAKDWDLYGALHTEHVETQTWSDVPDVERQVPSQHEQRVRGRQELVTAISGLLGGDDPHVATMHRGFAPCIAVLADDWAVGRWTMEDELRWEQGDARHCMKGAGYYFEEYQTADGGWRISFRQLVRTWVDADEGFLALLDEGGEPGRAVMLR